MKLLLLLLCLGLTFVCAQDEGSHEVVTSDFEMSKISGEWYSILLASDLGEKTGENGSMRLFVESILVLDNSSLSLKYHIKVNGECTGISLMCDKTEEKDIYSVDYDGLTTFHMIEAEYSDYLIFYVLNFNNEIETQVMELYARKPDMSQKLKDEFSELCQYYGIPEENIVDLTKTDRCLKARGSHGAQDSSVK